MNIIGVSERIKKMCSAAGVNVKQMLLSCGLSDKVIDNMSKGSYPSIDKIALIAQYFKLSINQLIYEQPNDNDIFWRLSHFSINHEPDTMKPIQDTLDDYLMKKGVYTDISEEFKYKYLSLSKDGRKIIDEILDFTYNKEKSSGIVSKEVVARNDDPISSKPSADHLDNISTTDEE